MSFGDASTQYPLRLVVDGEYSIVKTDRQRPGAYHYDWVSAPNIGYGFSSRLAPVKASPGLSATAPLKSHGPTLDEHVTAIRDFLTVIDPDTELIEDA